MGWTCNTPATLMHTTTTRLNTSVLTRDTAGDDMIRAWSYWIVQPKALLSASQWLLLTAVLSCIALGYHSQIPFLSIHASVGLILLLLTVHLCCYGNRLADGLVAPSVSLFVATALASLAMALLLIVPVFAVLPGLFPG